MELIKAENISFSYPGSSGKVLNDISFSIADGEFAVICGDTGCGKSTLLRLLKPELTPVGCFEGSIKFSGHDISAARAADIGFVAQSPEDQIISDSVSHELAFGLESMGTDSGTIRRRIAEMASWFGIDSWFSKRTDELSGGQKQILNLAAVMAAGPRVLLLDEPTSQLDPLAAADFISALSRINRELSVTVIIVEHRFDELFSFADRVLLMDKSRIVFNGVPKEAVSVMAKHPTMREAAPCASRIYASVCDGKDSPLSVRDGKIFITENFHGMLRGIIEPKYTHCEKTALRMSDIRFRYSRNLPDILCGLDLTVYENEILCILGSNGSGKTTALNCAAGIMRPYCGKISIFGKPIASYKSGSLYKNCVAYLPQDVKSVFMQQSVSDELTRAGCDVSSLPYDITSLLPRHPFDLSGGEQQLVALAKILAQSPRLLFLDEPTKGLDARYRSAFIRILKKLRADGMTVVIITHDTELAALCADRCAMFFRGEITSSDTPRRFFSSNNFYTTPANRITRSEVEGLLTAEDVISQLAGAGDGND